MNQEELAKVADTAAGGSIVAFGISWASAAEVVTVIAGCVAVIAGLAATWFHVEKALETRRKRLRRYVEPDDSTG